MTRDADSNLTPTSDTGFALQRQNPEQEAAAQNPALECGVAHPSVRGFSWGVVP
jgi:hypothetical protein